MLVSEIVAPPFGSYLLNHLGPYNAFLVGLPIQCLGLPFLVFIPKSESNSTQPDVPPATVADMAYEQKKMRTTMWKAID
jgi:hypothetical protein